MIRHVVLLTWVDDASDEARQAVLDGLSGLPAAIPEIQEYRFGDDIGVNEGNASLAVVADFATVDDYLVYRDHPAHVAVITDHIRPILASRVATQFEC